MSANFTLMRPPKLRSPEVCPVCGEDVPRGSLACPRCGADHRSGWREEAGIYDGVDVPDGNFDYDEFVREEFGGMAKPPGLHPVWWVTGIILLIALAAVYVHAVR